MKYIDRAKMSLDKLTREEFFTTDPLDTEFKWIMANALTGLADSADRLATAIENEYHRQSMQRHSSYQSYRYRPEDKTLNVSLQLNPSDREEINNLGSLIRALVIGLKDLKDD